MGLHLQAIQHVVRPDGVIEVVRYQVRDAGGDLSAFVRRDEGAEEPFKPSAASWNALSAVGLNLLQQVVPGVKFALLGPVHHLVMKDGSTDPLHLPGWSDVPEKPDPREGYEAALGPWVSAVVDQMAGDGDAARFLDMLPLSCVLLVFQNDELRWVYVNARQRLHVGARHGAAPVERFLPKVTDPAIQPQLRALVGDLNVFGMTERPYLAAWTPQVCALWKATDPDEFKSFRLWSGLDLDPNAPGRGGAWKNASLGQVLAELEPGGVPATDRAQVVARLAAANRIHTALHYVRNGPPFDPPAHLRTPAHDLLDLAPVAVDLHSDPSDARVYPFLHKVRDATAAAIGLGFARRLQVAVDGTTREVDLLQWFVAPAAPDWLRKDLAVPGDAADPSSALVQALAVQNLPASRGLLPWQEAADEYLTAIRLTPGSESFLPRVVAGQSASVWSMSFRIAEGLKTEAAVFGVDPVVPPPLQPELVRAAVSAPNAKATDLELEFANLHPSPGARAQRLPASATFKVQDGAFNFDKLQAPTTERKLRVDFDIERGRAPHAFSLGALDLELHGKGPKPAKGWAIFDLAPVPKVWASPAAEVSRLDMDIRDVAASGAAGGQDEPGLSEREAAPRAPGAVETIEEGFARESPLVMGRHTRSGLLLSVEETAARARSGSPDREMTIKLTRDESVLPSGARVVVVDAEPFSIFGVASEAMVAEADEHGAEIASRVTRGAERGRWRLYKQQDAAQWWLPSQTIGEEMEKSGSLAGDVAEGGLVAYRFAPAAHLVVQVEERSSRTPQPPWNIRALLSDSSEDLPGVQLLEAMFHLAWGMRTLLKGGDLRLVEQAGWRGEPPRPSYARTRAVEEGGVDAPGGPAFGPPLLEKYKTWARAYAAWKTRLGVYEVRDETTANGVLDRDRDVQFELLPHYTKNPLSAGAGALRPRSRVFVHDGELAGGVLWGFESAVLLEAVVRTPTSVGGAIRRLAFTALGGSGDQDALFDERRTKISTTTDIGNQHGYTLIRIGRIGVVWNRAIHVIRFERAPLRSPQFEGDPAYPSTQDAQKGRMMLRKVEEYVEILEDDRATGVEPVTASEFGDRRIRVDSAWGRDVVLKVGGKDVDYGWEVPLWNAEAADQKPMVYPFPNIRLRTRTGDDAARREERHQMLDPQKLHFYTDARPGTGANSDLWEPIYGVDYIDAADDFPDPKEVELSDMRRKDDRAPMPSPAPIPPGLERFTWRIGQGERTNLVAGRSPKGITAQLETLTLMRALKSPPRAKEDTVRQAANRLAPAVKAMEDVGAALERDVQSARQVVKAALAAGQGSLDTLVAEAVSAVAEAGDQKNRLVNDFPVLPQNLEVLRKAAEDAATAAETAVASGQAAVEAMRDAWKEFKFDPAQLPLEGEFPATGPFSTAKVAVEAALSDLRKAWAKVDELHRALIAAGETAPAEIAAEIAAALAEVESKVAEAERAIQEPLAAARRDAERLLDEGQKLRSQVEAARERVKDGVEKAKDIWKQVSDADLTAATLCKLAEKEIGEEVEKALKSVRDSAKVLREELAKERDEALAMIDAAAAAADLKPAALAALAGAEAALDAGLNLPGFAVQAVERVLKETRAIVDDSSSRIAAEVDAVAEALGDTVLDELRARLTAAEAAAQDIHDQLKSGTSDAIDAAAKAAIEAAETLESSKAQLQAVLARLRSVRDVYGERARTAIETLVAKAPVSWRGFAVAARDRALRALDQLTLRATQLERLLTVAVADMAALSQGLRAGATGVDVALRAQAMGALDAAAADFKQALEALEELATGAVDAFKTVVDAEVVQPLKGLATEIKARVDQIGQTVISEIEAWSEPVKVLLEAVRERFGEAREEIDDLDEAQPIEDLRREVRQVLQAQTRGLDEKIEAAVADLETAAKTQQTALAKAACDAFTDAAAYLKPVIDAVTELLGDPGKLLDDFTKQLDLAGQQLGEVFDRLETEAKDAFRALEGQLGQVTGWASELLRELPDDFEFRKPSGALALLRAFGTPPDLPDLGFNRETLAYFFDLPDRVRITPSFALLDRFGGHMRGLSVSLPTVDLSWRLEPPDLEFPKLDMSRIDLGEVLPDLGWLKLDALLNGKPIGGDGRSGVTVTHGVDKKARVAWARADINLDLGETDLLPPQIMRLTLLDGYLKAHLRLETNLKGETERDVKAELKGDWALGVAGVDLATMREAKFEYDLAGGPRLTIDPAKIDYSSGLAFLSALAEKFAPSGDFSEMERLLEGGFPKAFSTKIDIPIPDVAAGAFALTNLQFSAAVEGEILPEFRITARAALGGPTKPFALTVSFLGGGGYFSAKTSYSPISKRRSTEVVLAIGVCAGAAFSLGPIGGGVMFWFGLQARFVDDGAGGGGFSAAAILIINGSVVIWGFVSISLGIVLAIEYTSGGGAIGYGSVSISIRISRFFTKSYSTSFQKVLSGQGSKSRGSSAAMSALPDDTQSAAYAAAAVADPGAPRQSEAYGSPLFDPPADPDAAAAKAAALAKRIFQLLEV